MRKKYRTHILIFLILFNYSLECFAWQELDLGLDQTSIEIKQYQPDKSNKPDQSSEQSAQTEQLADQTSQVNLTEQIIQNIQINILRFDPKYYEFVILCASANNNISLTLQKWSQNNNLVAAINASMFKEDRLTSIGYLKSETYINNSHIANRLGSFFLSGAKKNGLDNIQIKNYNKNTDDIENTLNSYNYAVQNFRILDEENNILWADSQTMHAITALAKDKNYLYFIHSANPTSVYNFAQILMNTEIDNTKLELDNLLYLEGGVQAAMFVNSKKLTKTWTSKHSSNILFNDFNPVLPNIIGVKAKASK